MGSCCASVKINPQIRKDFQVNTSKQELEITGIKSQKPEEIETIPLTRIIIRGVVPESKEVSAQEKTLFLSGTDNPNYFVPYGITFSCKKGIKSTPTNQDDFSIIQENGILIISVFDGHGIYGNDASHYLHIILPHMILSHPKFPEDIDLILKETYFKCNIFLNKYLENLGKSTELSGSTCTLIILINNILYTSNIGDSKAILIKESNNIKLTIDHKPSDSIELERIIKSGGLVRTSSTEVCSRIFAKGKNLPGICVSRAFGDSLAQTIGVVAEPDINKREIRNDDVFIVVGSDGVWEFLSDLQVCDLVKNSDNPAKAVADFSWTKWRENENDAF
ncbi:hypothetical protein SteCoe_14189 [Stentor coeruleus]|uniref:PPM-type phosphatase domain-containing protein n=1 Tax=Stentor coeruleus TaxID=5963 RepID=A0A1R2C6N8_9CILI|nr:hypothetical protein SteCoe_14189 [Stentor coeruleus]